MDIGVKASSFSCGRAFTTDMRAVATSATAKVSLEKSMAISIGKYDSSKFLRFL